MELNTREEAARAGQHIYYTGKPCKYGHIAHRYVLTGACKTCSIMHSENNKARFRQLLAANRKPPSPSSSPPLTDVSVVNE